MTIESYQRFIESFCPSACVPVDLVKIARNLLLSNAGPRVEHEFRYQPPEIFPSPLCLVMDGECCLDRLYGGYFGDWVCGGQWNRMVDFLRTFFQVVNKRNMEITVFFNGALEPNRMSKWVEKQKLEKEKIAQVLRHTTYKGTPPPKVWWVAPNGLRTCLRIVLRHLKVNVVLTTTDHHQEVMSYLKKYNYHGLLADDPEYIMFDPPRYFSSAHLKLTFKGCLETKEYILNEVTRCLNLHPSRICIVAALLGNHILTDSDLADFHLSLSSETNGKISPNILIKAVVDYVRNIQSVDDLNAVAWQVFGANSAEKCNKFKQCVAYYCSDNKNNGTQLSTSTVGNSNNVSEKENMSDQSSIKANANKVVSSLLPPPASTNSSSDALQIKVDDILSCRSKFASETDENEISNLKSFHQVIGKAKHGAFYQLLSNPENSECDANTNFNSSGSINSISNYKENFQDNSMNVSGIEASINVLSLKQNNEHSNSANPLTPLLPNVVDEVTNMSLERHQKGLMHPFIYQILSRGEIKIPVIFEDDAYGELPHPTLLYRPLRQMIYALLFNQHHLQYLAEQKKEKDGIEEKVPEIVIKEWVWSQSNKYNKPDYVPSIPLGWPVPTVFRLWFTSGHDANKKRLQAFLTCMRSNTPLICDPQFVPQHFIILCCVLRYMLSSPEMPFLYKHELDAFLVQAVDSHLMDTEYTQKLEVPLITPRGVMLAAMFMNGVDHALMANDACGAPISWLMCCPWLFFDGKIFHRKLIKSNSAKNLMDLCDNRIEEMSLVDHMRNAIFEGLKVRFLTTSRSPLRAPQETFPNYPLSAQPFPQGRGRGHQRVVPRGGQLEVAGVVVGSWGPNYGQGPRSPNRSIPPQVVSVGGVGRGRPIATNTPRRGFGVGRSISARGTSPPRRTKDFSSAINQSQLHLGMGRGAVSLESAKQTFYDLGYEI